jgi:hypothetical protein
LAKILSTQIALCLLASNVSSPFQVDWCATTHNSLWGALYNHIYLAELSYTQTHQDIDEEDLRYMVIINIIPYKCLKHATQMLVIKYLYFAVGIRNSGAQRLLLHDA